MDTSDLDEVFGGDALEHLLLLHELWKLDVDGGSKGGSEIGWARCDVTKMLVVGELAYGLDVSGSSTKSVENLEDASSWLHGDDSELILLIDPDEESLGIVMEDTSACWPVSVEVACLQESVSLLEEEMVINERLLIFFAHAIKWVESTSEVTFEGLASCNDLSHDLISLNL
jgi:hypothetical protein